MKCRHCSKELSHTFIDLGSSPPSNSYLSADQLKSPEVWFPLKVLICDNCWLVQTEDFIGTEQLFTEDYAYFSSYSSSWVEHARQYVEHMVERLKLSPKSTVVEIASNDGYLLQFVKEKGVPCYGVEPTRSTSEAAKRKGIEVVEEFFGVALARKLASEEKSADLIVANNVLAHVPNINDFVKGFSVLLKPTGTATFEFPHIVNLIKQGQFDTIYHEHYSYLSLTSVQTIFSSNGLTIYDAELLPTHGGSLRVYAQRSDSGKEDVTQRIKELLEQERRYQASSLDFYQGFQYAADKIKNDFLMFLISARDDGLKVAAYGAAAKGNTLLNYAGIRHDLIKFVVDRNPAKQNHFMPGSRIPIVNEQTLIDERPDLVIILPWNLKNEIIAQLSYIRDWGGRFVVTIPKLEVI